jgi:NAD(P)H dehydrogenase (quinone)
MIAITGASGQLGRFVITHLQRYVPATEIVAIVRTPERVQDFADQGIQIRTADYDAPETWASALHGIDKLLLISSNAVGQRATQHATVINAAKIAGVGFLAYTSLLKAESSPMILAAEHKTTEEKIKASGLTYAILRNGWYNENYAAALDTAKTAGVVLGCAGAGEITPASRSDYAEAAAIVLHTPEAYANKILELAGDTAFTLSHLAETIGDIVGAPVAYQNLPQDAYAAALKEHGVPDEFADVLADSDAGLANGWLCETSNTLSTILGHPTTPIADTLRNIHTA